MNDEIERLNKENERINNYVSSGNQSRAAFSNITTNEEDKKRSLAEGIISDLSNQRADIDSIKQALTMIEQQINQIANVLNQGIQTQGATLQPEVGKINMEAIGQLGDLLEKGVSAWKSLKGNPAGPAPLIDQDFINKRMVQSFMDDLDTGTSITNFIKDSLKKKVTKEVINKSLSDMGKQDTHAPQ